MEQLKRNTPAHFDRYISIGDMHITSIVCKENSVEFHFKDGFTLVDGNNVTETKRGYIELSGCDADEFSCYIIKRKASPKGAKSRGEPISLIELSDLLSKTGKSVEVYLELYNHSFLHWRGEFFPYRRRHHHRLSDRVVIETMDFFPMTYYWEE